MKAHDSSADVVIVGAGQAGGDVACALRSQGFSGSIIIVGDEIHPPYRRPPLTKAFLSGEVELASLYLVSPEWYGRQQIDCRYGTGVESINRQTRSIRLFDGTTLSYRSLVLATGGRARRLSLPGADRPNVHHLRNVEDIIRLKEQFLPGKRLLVIGGGYIGLEAASVGIKRQLKVTLIEALPRVLARVTAPELSAFYERAHRSRGVTVRTGVGVHELEGEHIVEIARLSDGTRVPVDLVIVGIGLIPNVELADSANLAVSNGIVVDAYTRTADPDIYAIGDCSNHENTFLARRLRLESVANAAEQARVCASAICGKGLPHSAVPWFWSDQYDLKLQAVGLSEGYDQIAIRGDEAKECFIAFYLRDGVVIAADAVNRAPDFMMAKRLVAQRCRATAAQLIDVTSPLRCNLTA
jgi:3-phenylpropionate/trans-cinnamate dioxygenase ferredoxin reductase component